MQINRAWHILGDVNEMFFDLAEVCLQEEEVELGTTRLAIQQRKYS